MADDANFRYQEARIDRITQDQARWSPRIREPDESVGIKRVKLFFTVTAICLVVASLPLVSLLSATESKIGVLSNLEPPVLDMGRFPAPNGHKKDCYSNRFAKETLKTIKESNFLQIMLKYSKKDTQQEQMNEATLLDSFEASGLIASNDGTSYYVVFDNSFKIGKVNRGIHQVANQVNELITWPGKEGDESQFESIAYNATSDTYLVLAETWKFNKVTKSRVHEIKIKDSNLTVIKSCPVEHEFSHENKGIEGAAVVKRGNKSILMALCEGNFCEGGKRGKTPGNGRLLVFERVEDSKGGCAYKQLRTIKLPKEVKFMDYSSISVYMHNRVAISSQENSAVWVADIVFDDSNDEPISFENGKIYDFPRNSLCEIIYCNIEGVYFEGENILVAVSDKKKGHAKQPFVCNQKSQGIHTFSIPQ